MIASVESAGVLFSAIENTNGRELWNTDGTEGGTVVLLSGGLYDSFDGGLVEHRGAVYFAFREASTGRELWTTDGTPARTRIVKDIDPGPNGSVSSLVSFGAELYFQAVGHSDVGADAPPSHPSRRAGRSVSALTKIGKA